MCWGTVTKECGTSQEEGHQGDLHKRHGFFPSGLGKERGLVKSGVGKRVVQSTHGWEEKRLPTKRESVLLLGGRYSCKGAPRGQT